MNENNKRDELFRNRIREALHQLNGQTNGFDSNAAIEAELAEIDAAPMDESEVSRIMNQVNRSIIKAAKSREGVDVMQNRRPSQTTLQPEQLDIDTRFRRRSQSGSAAIVAIVTTSLCLLTAYGLFQVTSETSPEDSPLTPGTQLTYAIDPLKRSTHHFRYVAQARPQAAPPERLVVGQTIRTAARERRRAILPDGSILYLNEQSTVALTTSRTVTLHRGQLFVEVTPANISGQGPFVVETPDRSVTALGTKFAVSTDDKKTEVLVTQGKVKVSGIPKVINGGQFAAAEDKDSDVTVDAAPRASQSLSWTRELIAAAETSLVPRSEHDGGSLVVVDPSGQEMKLSLRKFHVDAHIEDGFARTTIDQTYFNHTHSRQEGTFKFPLPPDASLSRLAMYVNGKLMEGGMVERDHGRNVFEQIMHTKRDPALLEWVDGSTFKMRVFPLEPRQEKRIVLSYTQRLPNDYDRTEYRFPAGHSFDKVRDWSTRLTVANGAGKTRWFSPTHLLKATDDGDNLVLEGDLHNAVLDKDLVVELTNANSQDNGLSRKIEESVAFSSAHHEGFRYEMLRFRPNLSRELDRPRRNWVFLYESSGDRNPLLARVQLDVISTMLEHAEHDDTFSIISAATESEAFRIKPVRCSKKNIQKAIAWLEKAHLVGALDLEEAFAKAKPFCKSKDDTLLIHVGTATAVLGERDEKTLLKSLPSDIKYVGVGVGKRWSRSFMKSAAGQTGGHFTQINPDEKVNWRAFELISTLNAPRLINLKVDSGRKGVRFLTFTETIAHGQEIAATARLPLKAKPLESVTVTGSLNGQQFSRKLPVSNVAPKAGYLPRTWTRLEIDRLVANGSAANKDTIIALSKAMYVMSPFTSLLVLEDEAMYEQFNVDRGRKDHWALYPAPAKIKVVHEPGPTLEVADNSLEALRRQLRFARANRDVARANLDLGIRDTLPAEQLAKMTAQLDAEQVKVQQAQRRLEIAEQQTNNQSLEVAKSVLCRRPPSMSIPASYVYGNSRRRFSRPQLQQSRFHFARPSGITPLGERDFRHYWGFQTMAPPNDIDVYAFSKTEGFPEGMYQLNPFGWGPGYSTEIGYRPTDLSFGDNHFLSAFNGVGSRFITNNRKFSAAPIVERISRYEMAYRMQGRPQGIDLPTLKGFVPQDVNFSTSQLFNNPDGYLGWYEHDYSTFDVDMNGDGLIDDAFLGVRPRILLGSEESPADGRWFLSTTPLRTRLRRGNSVGTVRIAGSLSNSNVEFITPEWSDYVVDYGLTDAQNGRALFDQLYDYDEFGIDSSGLTFTVPTSDMLNWQMQTPIPVTPYYSTLIERYSDEDRYDRVPVLDGFNTHIYGDLDNVAGFIPHTQWIDGRVHGQELSRHLVTLSRGGTRVALRGLNSRRQRVASSELVHLPIQRAGILRNILSYAPGMQTSTADILSVIESESKDAKAPVRGKIDSTALRLVKKARSLGWEQVTVPGNGKQPATTFRCNGAGHFRIEHRTNEGLREQVASDGKTMLHLYPELGIGAERKLSRFHRRNFQSVALWLLPPADDLTIGCDVEAIGESTIRITMLSQPETQKSKKGDKASDRQQLAVELLFNDDGYLVERRLVELSSDHETGLTVIARCVFTSKGNIQFLSKDDKLLAEYKIQRAPVPAPSAEQSTDGLVILPLPYRSADSYSLNLPAQPASDGKVDYSQLSESDAMKLVATHVATSDFDALWNVINQRFVAKDDCRMGFAVLLSGAANGNSTPIHEVASHNQGSSALGSFLVQHFDWWKDQDRNKEIVLPDSASPFIKHLANTHNLYALWSSGRATQDRTESQVNKELSRALELLRNCRSKQLAWTLLNVVHKSIDETIAEKKLLTRLAKEAASFEKEPGLFGAARSARVLWLISSGKTAEARSLYSNFRHDAAKSGIALPASDKIRSAFKAATGDSKLWSELILESAKPLSKQKRQFELLQLALNCAVIAEHETARQLLDMGIKNATLSKRPDMLITGLQCLITIDDWERAEDFARRLINYRNARESSALWRTASQIATALGDDDESLRRLEQAMRLEFSSLPETVNVEAFRADYNKLFDRFVSFAEAMLEKGKPLPDDFVERISQVADAWRSIDPDPTSACQRAAKLLQLVGQYDSAWEYWTTPLVNTANSSSAWTSLATALAETNQIHRASHAWSEAFAAEPTNPELLWKHAELLRNHNQPEQARKLLSEIVNGKWQPRFAHYKTKAKSLLQKM